MFSSTLDSNTKRHPLLGELKIPNQFMIVPDVKHNYQNLCEYAVLAVPEAPPIGFS